jgi:hypothetical protein
VKRRKFHRQGGRPGAAGRGSPSGVHAIVSMSLACRHVTTGSAMPQTCAMPRMVAMELRVTIGTSQPNSNSCSSRMRRRMALTASALASFQDNRGNTDCTAATAASSASRWLAPTWRISRWERYARRRAREAILRGWRVFDGHAANNAEISLAPRRRVTCMRGVRLRRDHA